ncbi:MAG TPA: HypC/HybG/HupF family hydrogenase formation chaperone [Pirellulaceae bacterium]|nr:HypC/HybG/HupF family hydrogenase formation chaperone [Pirellulaceae bacterium]
MCLGIPGKIIKIYREHDLLMGKIDFGGIVKQACLETLPELVIGDYVLIHVGFALAKLDEAEAQQIFSFLEAMNDLAELQPLPNEDANGGD